MNIKNFAVLFAISLALLVVAPLASAFGNIAYVETNGVLLGHSVNIPYSVDAGETLDLRVVFNAFTTTEDVRISARILGEPGSYEVTERFDVIGGNVYSKLIQVELPMDIDPQETFTLEVRVESQSNTADILTSQLTIQRESYSLAFLSVEHNSQVSAGETLPINLVLENQGRRNADNTFVKASIPALGISKTIFLEDLSALDDSNDDEIEDDAMEGTILLAIPANAAPGLYTVELRAFNDDTETLATRRIEVVAGGSDSVMVSSASSKTFAVNADGNYRLTIVNPGNKILVYNLVTEADDGLAVELDDSVVVIPAGSSKTVDITARANREGTYSFTVRALSADNVVVGEQMFTANVEGRAVGGNAAVVLTIILAIVFVVLLVVLIVLLTRKPAKSDELGESYY